MGDGHLATSPFLLNSSDHDQEISHKYKEFWIQFDILPCCVDEAFLEEGLNRRDTEGRASSGHVQQRTNALILMGIQSYMGSQRDRMRQPFLAMS